MAEREKGCSVENLHLVAEKGRSNLEEVIAVPICRLSGGNFAFHGRDADSPPNNGIPAAETVACISPFCTFGRIHIRTNPKRPFGRPFGVRCLCSVFYSRRGFPFPLPVGRALFIVYPADDLFDRWLLAVHEHAYAVNLRPDPRHQYEASVQQADA
ncbi:hypothetical protein PGS_00009840 [Porphyromonas gingivalis A7A1-28]|nr:hypothetical protein PGS_00009840 [Porphyromonas gingivalis A7A1-28]